MIQMTGKKIHQKANPINYQLKQTKSKPNERIQVSNNDTSESFIEISSLRNEREIWVSTRISVSHMHPAVKHDSLAVYRDHHAAFPNFLACP